MIKKRLILGVTGIRSEYDIMSSVFHEIKNHSKLDLQIVVTGAHLSEAYGHTITEIKKDGFTISDEIENLINGDNASSRVKGLAIQLQGLVQTVIRVKPDILLVLGDREESINTALIGAYMNIPVAHVGGGDRVVGNVDDQIRHAVTKLAHIHLTTNKESAERISKLGEQSFRIFDVGNPGLDRFVQVPNISLEKLSNLIDFQIDDNEPFIIVIQHVISSEIDDAYIQMKESLEAISEFGIKTVLIYPNSDAGGQKIVSAIEDYASLPFLHLVKNLPRLEFVNLMRHASCLLGNSSAGILEAPHLKLPVINVGNRQKGRLHADNIQFVAHNKDHIISALKLAVYDQDYRYQVSNCINPYGDGHSSKRIAEILSNVKLDDNLIIKDISY